jgi:peroxiredoxin
MLVVYVPQFVRAFAVVFFVSALSFTMALLSDNVSAGMLVCLYVVLVMAGKAFLPKLLDPSLVQNNGAYIAFGLAILCLGLRFYGRKRRGSAPPPAWISSAGFAFFGLTAWFFYVICIDGHDPHIHEDRALNAMQTQDTSVGLRAAGYLLPDQDGKLSGLAQFSGSIYVIALWSPNDPDCDQLLGRLNAVQAKLRNVGVQVVAVCLSDDNSAARTFAKGDNLLFPVVTDWGTVDVPEKLAMSPIASAYRTSILPMVAVTDRRRRIVDIMRGTTCYDGHTMNDTIQTVISKDH